MTALAVKGPKIGVRNIFDGFTRMREEAEARRQQAAAEKAAREEAKAEEKAAKAAEKAAKIQAREDAAAARQEARDNKRFDKIRDKFITSVYGDKGKRKAQEAAWAKLQEQGSFEIDEIEQGRRMREAAGSAAGALKGDKKAIIKEGVLLAETAGGVAATGAHLLGYDLAGMAASALGEAATLVQGTAAFATIEPLIAALTPMIAEIAPILAFAGLAVGLVMSVRAIVKHIKRHKGDMSDAKLKTMDDIKQVIDIHDKVKKVHEIITAKKPEILENSKKMKKKEFKAYMDKLVAEVKKETGLLTVVNIPSQSQEAAGNLPEAPAAEADKEEKGEGQEADSGDNKGDDKKGPDENAQDPKNPDPTKQPKAPEVKPEEEAKLQENADVEMGG